MLSGDYKIINKSARVSIVTLTSPIEDYFFDETFTVGSQKTENLGVERIITNVVENPQVRAIIICGRESFGHYAGQALLSLWKNGTDSGGKIICARGPIPYIENLDTSVIERFREQILYMEDMIGTTDQKAVHERLLEILTRDMPKFDKPALSVVGVGKKAAKKHIHLENSKKLTLASGILIDPYCFAIECKV